MPIAAALNLLLLIAQQFLITKEYASKMGTRYIGVTGMMRSGKTTFVTSLINLWLNTNLCTKDDLRKKQFDLGTAELFAKWASPKSEGNKTYERNRNRLGQGVWPDKTMEITDYELFVSTRRGKKGTRYVFVDLPGERFADAEFMTSKNIFDWSESIVHYLQLNEHERSLSKTFVETFAAVDSSGDESKAGALELAYRELLFNLVQSRHPLITPSSALLDLNGTYVPDSVQDDPDKLKAWFLNDSQLGVGGTPVFPIPVSLKRTATGKMMQQAFKNYRSKVVAPALGKFARCQDVIILCDVATVLEMGPAWMNTYEKLLAEIAILLDPGNLVFRRLQDCGRIIGKLAWQDKFRYVDRVFFGASQCDRIHSGDLNKLKHFANQIAGTAFQGLVAENKISDWKTLEIAAVDSIKQDGETLAYDVIDEIGKKRSVKKIVQRFPEGLDSLTTLGQFSFPRPSAHFPLRNNDAPRSRNMDEFSKQLLRLKKN